MAVAAGASWSTALVRALAFSASTTVSSSWRRCFAQVRGTTASSDFTASRSPRWCAARRCASPTAPTASSRSSADGQGLSRRRRRHVGAGGAAGQVDLRVERVENAVQMGNVVMLLVPDQTQKRLYDEAVKPNLKPGSTLMFAHGFNIHFSQIVPGDDVDVAMVAPKGPGHIVRRMFKEGIGVPALFAVHQDTTGKARARTLA